MSQTTIFKFFTRNTSTPKKVDTFESSTKRKIGDLVWAQLEGYPYWPGLIYNDEKVNKYFKTIGSESFYYIQFIDDPISYAWIIQKNIRPYNDNALRDSLQNAIIKDLNLHTCILNADRMIDLKTMERMNYKFNSKLNENASDINKENLFKTEICMVDDFLDDEMTDALSSFTHKKRCRKLIYSDDEEDILKDISIESNINKEVQNTKSYEKQLILPLPTNKKMKLTNKKNCNDKSYAKNIMNLSKDFKYQKSNKDDCDNSNADDSINTSGVLLNPSDISITSSANNSFSDKYLNRSINTNDDESGYDNSQPSSQDDTKFTHQTLEWLKLGKRKDIHGLPESHADYDGRTLYIPKEYRSKLTPALKQWWDMKARRFDCVLFFKVGKFYELYHMDAVLSVKELGLTYMKGGTCSDIKMAHSGFPEIAYGRYVDSLVEKGYRVCRVEQTETVHAMENRWTNRHQSPLVSKASSKSKGCQENYSPAPPVMTDKVVNREICRITSKGTKSYGYLDCLHTNESCPDTRYLMALSESRDHGGGGHVLNCSQGQDGDAHVGGIGARRYGVCLIDTAVGKFMIGQFWDDDQRSNLRTLITHHPPIELLLERGKVAKDTLKILELGCSYDCAKRYLTPGKEFWEATTTMKYFKEKFSRTDDGLDGTDVTTVRLEDNGDSDSLDDTSSATTFSKLIQKISDPCDLLSLTPKREYALAAKALGACIWYLQDCLLDHELMTIKENVSIYTPPTILNTGSSTDYSKSDGEDCIKGGRTKNVSTQRYMILDDITLTNLEVISPISKNITHDATAVTLYDRLHPFTCTAMGRRLLKNWLCSPLYDIKAINIRLDAVEDLGQNCGARFMEEITGMAKTLPDLERLLLRVHSLSVNKGTSHPDSRAVMFEEAIYSKRKIEDFISTLKGLLTLCRLINTIRESDIDFSSPLIRNILNIRTREGKNIWDLIVHSLNDFMETYDFEQAKKDGVLIPGKGIVPEYDDAIAHIKEIEKDLARLLKNEERRLKCSLTFWGTGKNRYQIEVAESQAHRVPDDYELRSQRKGAKRYRTKEIDSMVQNLTQYEYERDQGLTQSMRKIFTKFDERADLWKIAVNTMATLDALMTFARYSFFDNGGDVGSVKCRPTILANDRPSLEILGARHPCLDTNTFSGGEFIPNDIFMNCRCSESSSPSIAAAPLTILTGPNMGGKSTLLRQVGLISILAHVGCYVPAQSCRMSLIDRIFTRLGAHDNILKGESTFFVELKETATILNHATSNSLVLMDELGRGTATYDGVAIAHSVIRHITEDIKCRTLFSTHYHSLVDDFAHQNSVSLVHMACMVEDDTYLINSPAQEVCDEGKDSFMPDKDAITFLYKLIPGACPNSYGFHAALLAGMPRQIVGRAYKVAKNFEIESQTQSIFQDVWAGVEALGLNKKSGEEDSLDSFTNLTNNIKQLLISSEFILH